MDDNAISGPYPLMEELSVLRQRKSELEQQLNGLQESRKQLMVQLESLMKMIKVIKNPPINRTTATDNHLSIFFRISSYPHVQLHHHHRHRAVAKAPRLKSNR